MTADSAAIRYGVPLCGEGASIDLHELEVIAACLFDKLVDIRAAHKRNRKMAPGASVAFAEF
jgi:hypothetical protein